MLSKETLVEIHELMDLAIEASGKRKDIKVVFNYSGATNAVELYVLNNSYEYIYSNYCYLDWKNGEYCKEIKFPEFREVLNNLMNEVKEAV